MMDVELPDENHVKSLHRDATHKTRAVGNWIGGCIRGNVARQLVCPHAYVKQCPLAARDSALLWHPDATVWSSRRDCCTDRNGLPARAFMAPVADSLTWVICPFHCPWRVLGSTLGGKNIFVIILVLQFLKDRT